MNENENELERGLRTWHRAGVDADERAPIALRAGLAAIPHVAPAPVGLFGRRRFVLAAAALLAALLVGGVIGVGSGLIRFPLVLIVNPSPTETSNETPMETTRPAGWSATGAMAAGRWWHTATLLTDGRVLVAGGQANSSQDSVLGSAELFDPTTGTWSPTGTMGSSRYWHSAVRLGDGRVLVAGGESWGPRLSGTAGPISLSSAEIYDPISGTWSPTGDTQNGGGIFASTVLLADGKVLMVASGQASLFDPISGTWSATGQMVTPRDQMLVTLMQDGRVLATGGFNGGTENPSEYVSNAAEIYDPVAGTWMPTGSMISPRYLAAASLLADGRVLVSGGWDPYLTPRVYLTSTEIYDPSTGTWSATGDMAAPRYDHRSTVLASGAVLITGGIDPTYPSSGGGLGGLYLGSAELYDPATGTWREIEFMSTARAGQTATLLDDGSVLVAGGELSANDPALSSAELFDTGKE